MNGATQRWLVPVVAGLFAAGCDSHGSAPSDTAGPLAGPEISVSPAAVSIDPGGAAGVNTGASEGCPIESVDGDLFFASNRVGGNGGVDIWVAGSEARAGWSDPENLPAPVNSSYNDFCPTPLPGGELLFVSTRPGGCGDGTADIYRTRHHPVHGWLAPEHLGCELNSAGNEFSPSYVPAGGGALFFSSDRQGGGHAIFMSLRTAGGWTAPMAVTELNAPGYSTARPNVSADGRRIVFDSNRPGGLGGDDVWSSERASIADAWTAPLPAGAGINSPANEHRPTLSTDGKRLYFGSTRPGGEGSSDIYVAPWR